MKAIAEDKQFYQQILLIVCAFILMALPLMACLFDSISRAKQRAQGLETTEYTKEDRGIELQSTKSLVGSADGDDANEVVHAPASEVLGALGTPTKININDF